ncbi:MAG: carbonic anhydrase family protein [Burkholderiales bacterium]|nr:carbonic anhydrase family protein [Burkholderiales bacterium]
MKNLFSLSLLAVLLSSSAFASDMPAANANSHRPHWSYKGDGKPKNWAALESDFATCGIGKEQSPIDIRGAVHADLPALEFEYTAGSANVVNNGHTIQVNLETGGNLKLDTGTYQIVQFHFHTPSEEKIRGKAYSMVAHMVHKNAEGKLAVVAVLFKLGKTNPAIAKVFAHMPMNKDEKIELPDGFNPADLLPAKQTYYAFNGSLTTPPCTEGVVWRVLKQPVELSRAQLAKFKKLYPMNARPVQPLNGRTLQESP